MSIELKLLQALQEYPDLMVVPGHPLAVTKCGRGYSLITGDLLSIDIVSTSTPVFHGGMINERIGVARCLLLAFVGPPDSDGMNAIRIDKSKPATLDNVKWEVGVGVMNPGRSSDGSLYWNKTRQWWNNGIKNTRSDGCPGPEWVRGRLFSKEHVEQIKKSRSDNLSGLLTRKTYNTPDGPMTYYEYAERHNIRPTTAYQRIHKFNNPGPQKVYINTDGKTYGTLRELAEACNTGIASQHQRLKKGIIKKEYR